MVSDETKSASQLGFEVRFRSRSPDFAKPRKRWFLIREINWECRLSHGHHESTLPTINTTLWSDSSCSKIWEILKLSLCFLFWNRSNQNGGILTICMIAMEMMSIEEDLCRFLYCLYPSEFCGPL